MENIEELQNEFKKNRKLKNQPTKETLVELYRFLEDYQSNKEASIAIGCGESTVHGWIQGERLPREHFCLIMEKLSNGKVSSNKLRGK